jgi:hypothetical protein
MWQVWIRIELIIIADSIFPEKPLKSFNNVFMLSSLYQYRYKD